MLMPKRVKWRKQMRGRMTGKALRGAEVSFGEYGLRRWNQAGLQPVKLRRLVAPLCVG